MEPVLSLPPWLLARVWRQSRWPQVCAGGLLSDFEVSESAVFCVDDFLGMILLIFYPFVYIPKYLTFPSQKTLALLRVVPTY